MRRVGATAGIVGPLLFGSVVTTITFAEYEFMRSLGWDPLLRPTFDWPSGLSLGPLGWSMTATFIASGALMSVFAIGLRYELQNRTGHVGSTLLALAGLAFMGLAFSTDPTIRATPATWHGRLHDLSFLLLGLTLIPSMILLAVAFGQIEDWRKLSRLTWITTALAIPTFALKGIVFYAFVIAMLAWNILTAVNLFRITQAG